MNIDRPSLDAAVGHAMLGGEQADRPWAFLAEQGKDTPRFRFAHVLHDLGSMVAIGAMLWRYPLPLMTMRAARGVYR